MPDVIPLNDLMRANAPIRSELDREIGRVLDSGWFLRGRQVESFEEEWADYCGQKFCITCNSGTDALTLAAAALDISETSVQSNTSALTPIGLHRGGARIRIVDVLDDGRTGPELKNAVPVLLFGRAPSAAEARHRIFDAAHAHGWRPFAHATACWSFYPTKTLGGLGDGGAVTTNDPAAAGLMRDLCGRDDRFKDGRQITSRMDEIQAAVLRIKLKYLPSWLEQRREIAMRYRALLPPCAQLIADSRDDLHHLLVIRVEQRDQLQAYLSSHGVETKVHFPKPLHQLDGPWSDQFRQLPTAERWCRSILTLPCFPGLKETEIAYVADLIAGFYESSARHQERNPVTNGMAPQGLHCPAGKTLSFDGFSDAPCQPSLRTADAQYYRYKLTERGVAK
jgi:dTDP-4-amino-4,6-dideoxygalactose transaminase